VQPVVVKEAHRAHPHGGPPGQLKKQFGLKTGAEVVHRERVVVQPPPMISSAPVIVQEREHGNGKAKGHDKGHDNGNHGGGNGKGHGKGH